MHIAAAEPRYVSRQDVPVDAIDKEREIARAQAKNDPKNANKPDQVVDKIVEGLKRQEERMKPEFSFAQLLLDGAEKGESFTR